VNLQDLFAEKGAQSGQGGKKKGIKGVFRSQLGGKLVSRKKEKNCLLTISGKKGVGERIGKEPRAFFPGKIGRAKLEKAFPSLKKRNFPSLYKRESVFP